MEKHVEPIRVLVTGATGSVAYSLNYMIANGQVFGEKQPIILHLYSHTRNIDALEGVEMELMDCAFPLLQDVVVSVEPDIAFADVSAAFLCGAQPRKLGEDLRSLIPVNVRSFKEQGRYLDSFARKDVRVVVVGNPCNTNAIICMENAPSIPKENFSAMTRLDQNRAYSQIALKMNVQTAAVKNVVIWGNHTPTMYPDASYAWVLLGKTPRKVPEVCEESFLRKTLVETVSNRGGAVLKARKVSAAISGAKAAADHMRDWWQNTYPGTFTSMAVISEGAYGAPKDVMFSYPVEIRDKKWHIVKGLKMDDFGKEKLETTGKELLEYKAEALAELEKDAKPLSP